MRAAVTTSRVFLSPAPIRCFAYDAKEIRVGPVPSGVVGQPVEFESNRLILLIHLFIQLFIHLLLCRVVVVVVVAISKGALNIGNSITNYCYSTGYFIRYRVAD